MHTHTRTPRYAYVNATRDYLIEQAAYIAELKANLTAYNATLQTMIDGLGPHTFNWTEQTVYDRLDDLNAQITPFGGFATLNNYTNVNATLYPPENVTRALVTALNESVYYNQSVYAAIDNLRSDLYALKAKTGVILAKAVAAGEINNDLSAQHDAEKVGACVYECECECV